MLIQNPQIAYFAAVPKEDIVGSGRILAATFFRNVFGVRAERALSVFVALSAFGNVLSVIFSQGRCKFSLLPRYLQLTTSLFLPRTRTNIRFYTQWFKKSVAKASSPSPASSPPTSPLTHPSLVSSNTGSFP